MPEFQEIPSKESDSVNFRADASQKKSNPNSLSEAESSQTLAERHPDWPRIKMKFLFSPHETAEDMSDMKKYMQDADIYFYEGYHNEHEIESVQHLSDIDLPTVPPDKIDQVLKSITILGKKIEGTKYETFFRTIIGSKKNIGNMDIRSGDPYNYTELDRTLGEKYTDPDFDKTLNNLVAKFKKSQSLVDRRENIMIGRFEQELIRILSVHPELTHKPALNVFATMGTNHHASLSDKFRTALGVDTEGILPEGHIDDFSSQAWKIIESGKEPDTDMLAKVFVEDLISRSLRHSMKEKATSGDKKSRFKYYLALQFTLPEIEEIHKQFVLGKGCNEIIEHFLKSKNLDPLPKDNQELNKDLANHENSKLE